MTEERYKAEYEDSQDHYYGADVDLDDLESELDPDFIESNSTTGSMTSPVRSAKFEAYPAARTTSKPTFGGTWNVKHGTLGKRRRTDSGSLGTESMGSGGQSHQKRASSDGNNSLAPLKRDGAGRVQGLFYSGPRIKLNKHN